MDMRTLLFSQAIQAPNYSAVRISEPLTHLRSTPWKHFKGTIRHFGAAIPPQCLIVLGKGDNQRIVRASISHRAWTPGELGPL